MTKQLNGLSRRRFLTLMAGGAGATLLGGKFIRAHAAEYPTAASALRQRQASITLTTPGLPVLDAMPDEATQAADPYYKAYAGVLQQWLDANPGVALEKVSFNIWDQQGLLTAIAGDTVPSFFCGNVLGGWNPTQIRAAFAKGLAADLTAQVEAADVPSRLNPGARPLFERWAVDGRYYAVPWEYNVGNGIFYRRDLFKEAGIPEPTPEWTWADVREIAKKLTTDKVKGIGLQGWAIGWALASYGWEIMNSVPDPASGWNWRSDLTSLASHWQEIVEIYRGMVFEDKSALTDVTYTDLEVAQAFMRGDIAMMPNNPSYYTQPEAGDGIGGMAKTFGKPLNELVGWVSHPVGKGGLSVNTQAFLALISIDPNLSAEAVDKAFSLYEYVHLGEGLTARKKAAWEATQDLRAVFTDPSSLTGATSFEGVPGTAEDAWGADFINAIKAASTIPLVPDRSWFLPAEQNSGPTGNVMGDMTTKWAFTDGTVDVLADLKEAEAKINEQNAGFTSSIPDDVFLAGVRQYYSTIEEYVKTNAPTFYKDTFAPWFERVIKPVIG